MGQPIFTQSELHEIHSYCLQYRDLVRAGGIPTDNQTEQFLAFSNVCYGEGVAYERA
jgi:hypothetical protein